MAAREQGYVTYSPRTFSFCPVIDAPAFETGFAACDRIVSGVYQPIGGGSGGSGGSGIGGGFTLNSVSYNYTSRVAMNNSCGASYTAYSAASNPDGLSCAQQVRLAPYILPGGVDDSFFTCVKEALRRADWLNSGLGASVIASVVMVAIFTLIPVGYTVWLLIVRNARAAKKAKALTASTKQAAEAKGSGQRSSGYGSQERGGEAGLVYLSFEDVHLSVVLNPPAQAKALEKLKAAGVTKPYPKYWNRKVLLKGVSGAFTPGSLTAIMGPSGCGKSTLLKLLSDRYRGGDASGRILLNGAERGVCFRRACGFVEQFDALFENLTVREMLMFTAELRCKGSGLHEKALAVDAVLKDLDLERVANSRIGSERRRGISGGQARRVTVGVEMVTSPSVLFLDEPTTGLDAYSSLLLVKSLRKLSDSGRTLLCTIHQPRPDIFELFDTVYLMSNGETAYFGPRAGLADYLKLGGKPIGAGVNPADHISDITSNPEEEAFVHNLVSMFPNSERGKTMAKVVAALGDGTFKSPETGEGLKTVEETLGAAGFAQTLLWQTYILSRRAYSNTFRSPDVFMSMFAVPMLQYLFFGVLYWGTNWNYELILSRGGVTTNDARLEAFMRLISQKRSFYFQVMSAAILTENGVMAEALAEQRAFRREHDAGAYSVTSYHLQWALRLNLRCAIKTVLFGSVVYFFPAHAENTFGDADQFDLGLIFFFFLMVMVVCSSIGAALALLFISLIPDAAAAAGTHNAVSAVLLQFSGYYLLPCLMPPLVNTAYFLSFGKYGLEAMLRNEFGTIPYGTQWNLFNSVQQSLDPTISRWGNLLILMIYPFVFHILALASSWYQTRPKSFWVPFEDKLHTRFPQYFPPRDELARAEPPPESAAKPKAVQAQMAMVEIEAASADAEEHV